MRLIDADTLKEKIEFFKEGHKFGTDYENGIIDGYDFCLDEIDNAPTVDKGYDFGYADGHGEGYELGKNSRPQGEWIPIYPKTVGEWEYKCSNCASRGIMRQYNFCPHCGAYMRGEEK